MGSVEGMERGFGVSTGGGSCSESSGVGGGLGGEGSAGGVPVEVCGGAAIDGIVAASGCAGPLALWAPPNNDSTAPRKQAMEETGRSSASHCSKRRGSSAE